MEELEEIKKDLEEALKKVNAKLEEDEGKDIYGKEYWILNTAGDIQWCENFNDQVDKFRRKIGNYFKTKEEAEEYLEDLKVKAEIKKIAKELNGDREIDWDNEDQAKYSLFYNCVSKNAGYDWEYSKKTEGALYCLDGKFMSVCIARIGREKLEKYLKRN